MWTFFRQLLARNSGCKVVSEDVISLAARQFPSSISKEPVPCHSAVVHCQESSDHWGRRSLRAAGLGSLWQRRSLARLGVRVMNQLMENSGPIINRSGRLVITHGGVQRWKQAVHIADQLPVLRPLDVLLLQGVQCRSWNAVASSGPRSLHRDIIRFSLTSRGTKLLADHELPTLEDVERWVRAAIQKRETHTVRS